MAALKKISIKGFKSIKELVDFELSNLNVFIGSNGAGKSNLIEFFEVIKRIPDKNVNSFIMQNGGINDFFFQGRKNTEKIEVNLMFNDVQYSFNLLERSSPAGTSFIDDEKMGSIQNIQPIVGGIYSNELNQADDEQALSIAGKTFTAIHENIKKWQIFHLNDTSKTASIRHTESVADDDYLRSDAANLAPFLLKLKNHFSESYQEIINAVKMVMPFFDDFKLDIKDFGKGKELNLAWKQKGSDYPFSPFHLSDGSIRFIALATALLQPEPPSMIIIDEPELGLHPEAIHILAELIKDASKRTQLVVATQSPVLINNFEVKDIVVVNRKNGASTFKRLNEDDFKVWLEDYSVGELWTKNVIAGGPVSE